MTAEHQTNKNSDTAAQPTAERNGASGSGVPSPAPKRRSTDKKGAAKAAAVPEQAAAKTEEAAEATGLAGGRQALTNTAARVTSTAGRVTSSAGTAWSVAKHRKGIVSGAVAGFAGTVAGAYLLGRRSAHRNSTWASARRTARDLVHRK
ncbi:hypothetical protein DSC45_04190 [Streptomyces sp. YIM 130001]|uniref:hypothetical protein n=1 Tax=Streptomyces sp. YIM 130001 TaxID=2259644 RepID=UPI000E652A58|nr:hypothetical protein [Streptomyces sp. YIM 130001]RII20404.1 hypothetical protein DSC45_04190 [Streptomyces sp. YIM 130001]